MNDIPAQHPARSPQTDVAPASKKPLWVVGIGAGAGGLEAIQLLFGAMPADVDLAFVIYRRVQSGLADPLAELFHAFGVLRDIAAGAYHEVVHRVSDTILLPANRLLNAYQ